MKKSILFALLSILVFASTVFALDSVITLAPSVTEIVCALGECEKVIGTDMNSDFPEELPVERLIVTNPDGSLNLEWIIASQPDLIIATEMQTPEQIAQLNELGLTVISVKNPESFEELFEQIRAIGELLDTEEKAGELCEDLEVRVENIAEKTAGSETGPTVFYEIDATDPTKPWTTGAGTFMDTLITQAGGKNITGSLDGNWLQVSLEYLIAEDPDIILLGDANYGVTIESVASRTGWSDLRAVKSGHVFLFDDDLASRPGPRLVDGLETMVELFASLEAEE